MGYPVAYYLCRTEAKVKHILTALALLPLWVPITVRLFGMMAILETGTLFAVEMGLVYCGLPYMIMILTGPIGNISRSVEEASYVCGAGFWTTFFKITFPLTLKGLASRFHAGLCSEHRRLRGARDPGQWQGRHHDHLDPAAGHLYL